MGMSTLDFARENIVFEKQSLISGPFNESRYRFIAPPLEACDSIATKTLVVFKASGCMGTVFLQIVIAKRIVCDTGDMYFVAQTDEDAKEWSVTRGSDFILRIPNVFRLRKMSDKFWQTQGRWMFRHKFLIITGPGKNARQSKQVRYVFTDESHLDEYENGALAEFDDRRQSAGWTGQSIHATTAPDSGREASTLYLLGRQNEWHWRCPSCHNLIWPLWEQYARDHYNGEQVFVWKDSQNEDETLASIIARCPHCSCEFKDTPRDRSTLNEGQYEAQNSDAPKHTDSFRWSVFAAPWIEWKSILAKHLAAKKAALLGDYSKAENFIKKQLCMIYTPEAVDYGDSHINLITWKPALDTTRICSFDFQEGKGSEGVHWWGQVDEYARNGDSMRVAFNRLETWGNCRQFQLDHKAGDSHTYCDAGYSDKEVFYRCSQWRWYALISSDSDQFLHEVRVEGKPQMIPHPYYTQTKPQDSMSGKHIIQTKKRGIRVPNGRSLPEGWCLSRTWSKPNIGFLLLRLKAGKLPMAYGVPHGFNPEFAKQLNSYLETVEEVKKTGARKRILKQVREADHAFSCSSQSLVGALVAGFLPVANQEEEAA